MYKNKIKKFENYGIFTIGPLKRNTGITFGNLLRRILLNNIKSIGIIEIKYLIKNKITSELHKELELQELTLEFSENIKNLIFIDNSSKLRKKNIKIRLKIQKEKRITAQDLIIPPEIEIVNKDHNLGINTIFEELDIQLSLGYNKKVTQKGSQNTNTIVNNTASFNPIQRVNYKVEKIISLNIISEQVLIEIWTNGSILPKKALIEATNICLEGIQEIKKKLETS